MNALSQPAEAGPVLVSMLTCPACGEGSAETMPTDACWYLWDCPHCGALVQPKAGDCCVFCSYGSAPCPPKQADRAGSTSCCPPS